MRDLSVRGSAVDAALMVMPYLIAAHLKNKHIDDTERDQMMKASLAIGRWIKEEAQAGR